jgi:serine/threonine-protein kinase
MPVPIPSPVSLPNGQENVASDPLAVVHTLEAWMPERIAEYKLRGFIQDVGGDVVESVPGRIRVRFGGRGSTYTAPRQSLSWLGIGRRANTIDMDLRMEHADPNRGSLLQITVVFRSPGTDLNASLAWRSLCTQIFCDLRGYLMGQTGAVGAAKE